MQWEKIEIVQKMQDYIKDNVFSDAFSLNELYYNIGYSKRHCNRIFKELIGKTLQEYVKEILISNSSKELLDTDKKIVEIALNARFETHEGYTRAFNNAFGITPAAYRKTEKPIPLFIQYPIKSYYSYLLKKEDLLMDKETSLCMITLVNKPARKLLILRSKTATDYFSYCEEMGCEWEGLFNSIQSKLDTAAILELPTSLVITGTSNIASGVEIPVDYNGEIPADCELVSLGEGSLLYFESEPFETEEDFFSACDSVLKAVEKYDPEKYGYQYDDSVTPRFNFGGETTFRYAVPVKKR